MILKSSAAVLVTLTAVLSVPAQALAQDGCATGTYCLYEQPNLKGGKVSFNGKAGCHSDLPWAVLPKGPRSVANRTSAKVSLYKNNRHFRLIPPGENFMTISPEHAKEIDSICVTPTR